MLRIANPRELQSELRRLVAYCSEGTPSREKLAAELHRLAASVAGGKVLQPKDIQEGTVLRNKEHPEWGDWKVQKKTVHDGSYWWDLKSSRGAVILHPSDLKFYELVKR